MDLKNQRVVNLLNTLLIFTERSQNQHLTVSATASVTSTIENTTQGPLLVVCLLIESINFASLFNSRILAKICYPFHTITHTLSLSDTMPPRYS